MTTKRNFQHKTKYKSTIFTRFLIFLLWFAPLTYTALMIYEGKNPIIEAKAVINKFSESSGETTQMGQINESQNDLELTIKSLEKELTEVKGDLSRCSRALEEATFVKE